LAWLCSARVRAIRCGHVTGRAPRGFEQLTYPQCDHDGATVSPRPSSSSGLRIQEAVAEVVSIRCGFVGPFAPRMRGVYIVGSYSLVHVPSAIEKER